MPKFNIKHEDHVRLRQKNRLIHAYFDIDLNVVWSTSTEDIPLLITELKKLVG